MFEKVPMSLRLAKNLKEEIEKIALESDMSVNSTINLMLGTVISDIKAGKRKIVSEIIDTNDPNIELGVKK